MNDVYHRLRERMDELSTGYPKTESGVEIRILKKLFTEKEADLFYQLSPIGATAEDVAKRLGREMEQTAELLNRMTQKGQLSMYKQDETEMFATMPYLPGIFESVVIDRELAVNMDEYYDTALDRTLYSVNTPLFRTIPINKEFVPEWPISPYDDALEILKSHNVFAVNPCSCRTWRKLADKGCEKAGLVLQPANNLKAASICSCCGDCCAFLRELKKQPVPSASVKSNYYAVVDVEKCTGCETCLDRCQMEAIEIVDDMKAINLDRCIGCGLCVSTCEDNAMSLSKKSADELYEPPKSGDEKYERIAQERGKI